MNKHSMQHRSKSLTTQRSARLLLSLLLGLASCAQAAGSSTTTPTKASNTWVMGYAVGYQKDLMPLSEMRWASLTHIAVGRMLPRNDGSLNSNFDLDALSGPIWAKSMVKAAHQNKVKAIMMLGGEGTEKAFQQAASPARRATFVKNILQAVQTYGFDGVDQAFILT